MRKLYRYAVLGDLGQTGYDPYATYGTDPVPSADGYVYGGEAYGGQPAGSAIATGSDLTSIFDQEMAAQGGGYGDPAAAGGSPLSSFGSFLASLFHPSQSYGNATGTQAPPAPGSYSATVQTPQGSANITTQPPGTSPGIMAWAQANPVASIAIVGLVVFALARSGK